MINSKPIGKETTFSLRIKKIMKFHLNDFFCLRSASKLRRRVGFLVFMMAVILFQ